MTLQTQPARRRFAGKVALVTGGSRGIGQAVARLLAAEGAAVVITGRDPQALQQAQATLGDGCLAIAGDAGDDDHARAAIDAACRGFGTLDVLVNNVAHVPAPAPLLELPLAELEAAYRINLRAPLAWSRLAIAAMGERGGSIVNVATLGAISLHPGMGAYGATKAGLIHLTRYLAAECGPRVRVNAVAPGLIRTDQSRAAWEGREARIATALPAGRLGEPADVAAAVAYLADPSNDWVTGETLAVDGGALVQLGRMRERR
jgi:NAD(P)-dependent dehydrogenase (short-subunit alcohol dehydrogenase family)